MNIINYSWQQLNDDTDKLYSLIKGVGFKPDIIVGIVRGGAVPAVILSHKFKNSNVTFLNWSTRDSKKRDIKLADKIAVAASYGSKVLIIEDIVDSGETMMQIKERMFDTKSNILYTSLWYNPNQLKSSVHLFANLIDRNIDKRWVVFPYE